MASGTCIVHLPLKSYLCKFLIKKYGTSYKISYNSLLGGFLIEILDKQYRRRESRQIKEESFYPIIVPKSIVEKVGFDFPTSKMRRFEQIIKQLFINEMRSHIDISIASNLSVQIHNKNYKVGVMKAMKHYLDYYDISEDDLKLESLYRSYQRHKTDTTTDNEKNESVLQIAG
jgi:hypothetical protein